MNRGPLPFGVVVEDVGVSGAITSAGWLRVFRAVINTTKAYVAND